MDDKCAHENYRKRYRYMQIGRWYFAVTGTLGTTRLFTRCIANLRYRNCTRYLRANMQPRNIFQKNNLDKPKRILFSLKKYVNQFFSEEKYYCYVIFLTLVCVSVRASGLHDSVKPQRLLRSVFSALLDSVDELIGASLRNALLRAS